MSKRIDAATVPAVKGTLYPSPYDEPCRGRERRRLGDEAGLSQFGVNLTRIPPGTWSSQRHWHSHCDEFVYVLKGELTLVTGSGSEILRAGDSAGFRAGNPDGHHLRNESGEDALILEIGTRHAEDVCTYPGIDLIAPAGGVPAHYTHTDGTPYSDITRRS